MPVQPLSRRMFLASATAFAASALQAHELLLSQGDGDHTGLLQKALRKGPVFLGPGTFNVSQLSLPSGANLRGVRGQTRLITRSRAALLVEGAEHVAVAGIEIAASGPSPALFSAKDSSDILIRDCAFSGGVRGVDLERCSGRVEDSAFSAQESGAVFSIDARGLLISDNVVENIGNNGIQIWRSDKGEDGTIVTNNRVSNIAARDGGTGQNGNGISVFRAGNVIIAGNRVTDCAFSAIRSNSGSGVAITGNSVARCEEVAIYSEFEFHGAVIADNSIEDSAFGISIANYDVDGRLAVCHGNMIRNLRQGTGDPSAQIGGIHCEADTLVANNVIEEARDYGVRLGWGKCRNLTARGNIIRRTRHGIEVSAAEDAQSIAVDGNTIMAEIGVIAMDHQVAVSGDLMRDPSTAPPHLAIGNNRSGT